LDLLQIGLSCSMGIILVLLPPFTSPPTCSQIWLSPLVSGWSPVHLPDKIGRKPKQTINQTNKQTNPNPDATIVASGNMVFICKEDWGSLVQSWTQSSSLAVSASLVQKFLCILFCQRLKWSDSPFFLSFFLYVATVHMVQFLVKWKKERKKEREREKNWWNPRKLD